MYLMLQKLFKGGNYSRKYGIKVFFKVLPTRFIVTWSVQSNYPVILKVRENFVCDFQITHSQFSFLLSLSYICKQQT